MIKTNRGCVGYIHIYAQLKSDLNVMYYICITNDDYQNGTLASRTKEKNNDHKCIPFLQVSAFAKPKIDKEKRRVGLYHS
jgi:hypothetical protein